MPVRRDEASAALPWGWWLRASGNAFEDSEGRRWPSVRDAFWQGRLGFPAIHFAPEQVELLLRVLSAIDRRWQLPAENKHDLFGGDYMIWRFYMSWLDSIGMMDTREGLPGLGPVSPLDAPLSDEGRSVLLMLQATREPAWEALPMVAVIEAVREAGRTAADDDRERALRRFEHDVALRHHLFARETVGRSHVVTLTGVATDARMPTKRVMWSQSFPDGQVRDDFFAWLAERVDRWEDWADLAYGKGAKSLTQHLFGLLAPRLSGG